MRRFTILIGVFAAMVAFGTFSTPVQASDFGLHFAGPGYHVDVGRADYGRDYYGGYRTARYGGYGDYGYGFGGWHDTSHYDYHPGEVRRHRNHFHYTPGHYDFHETGHWDHHGW